MTLLYSEIQPSATYGNNPQVADNIRSGLEPILSRDLESLIPDLRIGDTLRGTQITYTITRFLDAGAECAYRGDNFAGRSNFSYRDFIHCTLKRCLGGV